MDRDDELLLRAKQGDRTALSTLLKRLGPGIRREVALRISKPLQSFLDAHDVMQVTYMEVFLHLGEFEPAGPGALLAWIRRLAMNNLRDAIRGIEAEKRPDPRKRIQPAATGDSSSGEERLLGVNDSTPSVSARLGEARELLTAAVDRLPGDYRAVVQMCDLEGRPVADVAAELRRSPGAVHMLRARAHDLLRRHLPSASHILESRS